MTLADARDDWKSLDHSEIPRTQPCRLLSDSRLTAIEGVSVEVVGPGFEGALPRPLRPLANCIRAARLLRRAGPDAVLIVNGGSPLWIYVGVLSRLWPFRRGKTMVWGAFVESEKRLSRRAIQLAMRGFDLAAVWSKVQVDTHAELFGMAAERFIHLPFKANHSKLPRREILRGDYVFSGGNGKRDYACVVDAVRDTPIPVVISATDPAVRTKIEKLPNVIPIAAWEPEFGMLMAGSRFAVISMVGPKLVGPKVRGGGEANFCNAMWHGKAVIAADDMSAADYIIEGETGYVVPAGDREALRDRIVELWNDPAKADAMGRQGRAFAEKHFTQVMFVRRLILTAFLLHAESGDAATEAGLP